ncbi:MAG: bifunctional phosphoglucose/phosphomannose isomerase [Syntrophomonadales bacterium]
MVKGILTDGVKQMLDYIQGLPEQLDYCLQQEYQVPVTGNKRISNVVIAGMGGSAIGGDLLRCCINSRVSVPVVVSRDYRLPGFVGPDSLVLTASYSGNTEETLSAFKDAQARGAQTIAISTGGELRVQAEKSGVPLVNIPAGLPPRAALGYLFTPLALLVEQIGLVTGLRSQLQETATVLKQIRNELYSESPNESNPAFNLAQELNECIPVIWAVGPGLEVAAMRWKGQINENAKAPAYYNCFPELNHNEFTGLETPAGLTKKIAIVILQDGEENSQTARRVEITRDILGNKVKGFLTVNARGKSRMARLFSLMYTGDFVSTYLAAIYGIDPVPVSMIEELKKRLKSSQEGAKE